MQLLTLSFCQGNKGETQRKNNKALSYAARSCQKPRKLEHTVNLQVEFCKVHAMGSMGTSNPPNRPTRKVASSPAPWEPVIVNRTELLWWKFALLLQGYFFFLHTSPGMHRSPLGTFCIHKVVITIHEKASWAVSEILSSHHHDNIKSV